MSKRQATYGMKCKKNLAAIVFLIALSPLDSEAQTNITMCIDPETGAKSFSDVGCPDKTVGNSIRIDRANGDSGDSRVIPKVRNNKTFSADGVAVAGDSQNAARNGRNIDCISRGDCDGFDEQFSAAVKRKAEIADKTGVWTVSPPAPPSIIHVNGKACTRVDDVNVIC